MAGVTDRRESVLNTEPPWWALWLVMLFASWLGLASAIAAEPGDWPQWRGPDRNGVSTETGLLGSWPELGPAVAWKVGNVGEGYGAVAVVGHSVFVQGTRGDRSLVFRLDARTGEVRWTRELGQRLRDSRGNGPRSTPTIVGNTAYVLNGMGELAALSVEDGSVRWQVNILERYRASNIGWGISESPLVEGDHVLVMPGGRDGTIAAIDRSNGETVWTSKGLSDDASYSSLIAATVGDTRAIIGFTQEAGVGVRASDGQLLWRYENPANRTANAATPIYANDLVFYTSSYGVGGGAVRLQDRAGEITSEEAYFASNLQNHHGGVALYEGHLYGFFGPALACVHFETGEVKWRARSVGKGSLTVADGKLFLVGERHRVGLAEATPEGYRELGRFEIEDFGHPSWTHPVVSGGRLYIRNQHTLTAYSVAAHE